MSPKSKRRTLAARSDKTAATEPMQADVSDQTQEKTSAEPRILRLFACDGYDNTTAIPQSPSWGTELLNTEKPQK